jgi:phosphatidylserine/phosphatidylglycerophosphate/cardiolipin synthase-like enzyme
MNHLRKGGLAVKETDMRRLLLTLVLSLAFLGCQGNNGNALPATTQISGSDVTVYFSPDGGCTDAIVAVLGQAKETILVQAYSFTSAPIAKAVVDAHKRGVKVQVILDKSQRTEKYSSADFLAHAGVPVQIDDKHAIVHNKIMIIDGKTVITGSFNFTNAAEEHNAENLPVIHSKDLAQKYAANWQVHAEHSVNYQAK